MARSRKHLSSAKLALSDNSSHRCHRVITIHGIRTHGSWQERLKGLLLTKHPHLQVLNYKYSYFSIFTLWLWPFWQLEVRKFRRFLEKECAASGTSRIDIVAHSFGTQILALSLRSLPKDKRPKLHTIILSGSVLPRAFPWVEFIRDGVVKRVINECGIEDKALWLTPLVPFAGPAGLLGFLDPHTINRFHPFGHSGFFEVDGQDSSTFMESRWLPLILADEAPEQIDCRSRPSLLGNVRISLLERTALVRAVVYVVVLALIVTPAILLYNRWVNSKRINEARQWIVRGNELKEDNLGALRQSALLSIEASRITNGVDVDQLMRGCLELLPRPVLQHGQPEEINYLSFIPGRTEVVTASRRRGNLVIWDTVTGQADLQVNHAGSATASVNKTGTLVAAVWRESGLLEVWDWAAKRLVHTSQHASTPISIAFSPNGMLLALGMRSGDLLLLDTHTWNVKQTLHGTGLPGIVVFTPDGTVLATATGPHLFEHPKVEVWSIASARLLFELPHPANVERIEFSKDSKYLATAGRTLLTERSFVQDATARVWSISDGRLISEFHHNNNTPIIPSGVSAVSFVLQDKYLLTAGVDGAVTLWDLALRQAVRVLRQSSQVLDIAMSPDSKLIAVGTQDDAVRVWDWRAGHETARIVHKSAIHHVSFSDDSQYLASVDWGGNLRVVQLQSDQASNRAVMPGEVRQCRFEPNSTHIWIASRVAQDPGQTVRLFRWDYASGGPLELISSVPWGGQIVVSPDGSRYAALDNNMLRMHISDLNAKSEAFAFNVDGPASLRAVSARARKILVVPHARDNQLGKRLKVLSVLGDTLLSWEAPQGIRAATLSLEGDLMIYGCEDGTVQVVSVASEKQVASTKLPSAAAALSLSREGDLLAVAGTNTTYLFSVPTLKPISHLEQSGPVGSVVFGPGDLVMTTGVFGVGVGVDRSARVWHAESGEATARIKRLINDQDGPKILGGDISGDGRYLATYDREHSVHIEKWTSGDLADELCSRLTENFSAEEWDHYFPGERRRRTCVNLP